ncbi:hypothetical protein ASG48_10315 [Aurantimonas sp. Leaf443]|nr:hypothetical protein ASG48_10315 [Aurantimonas sp. Leaf443]
MGVDQGRILIFAFAGLGYDVLGICPCDIGAENAASPSIGVFNNSVVSSLQKIIEALLPGFHISFYRLAFHLKNRLSSLRNFLRVFDLSVVQSLVQDRMGLPASAGKQSVRCEFMGQNSKPLHGARLPLRQ